MAEEAVDIEVEDTISEEISEEIQDEIEVTYVEDFDPENPTPEQKKALDAGWKPEGVDGKEALTSKEFNGRQPLFDQLHSLKQQLKKQSKAIEMLIEQNGSIAEQARQKAIRDLTERKIEAIENGDKEQVFAIDNELDDLKKPTKVEATYGPEDLQETLSSYTSKWESRPENSWYKDPENKEYADYLLFQYSSKNPYQTPAKSEEEMVERLDKAFAFMESKMKERSSEKVSKPRPATVQSSSRKPAATKKSYSITDIKDPAFRQVAETIKRQNGNVDGYIKNLEKSGYFDK